MSSFIFTNSCTMSLIFSIPIWLPCSCCSICFCNRKGVIILLPFIVMPSIIASLLLLGQYCLILCSSPSFLCGQPCIIYAFSFCRLVSSCVAACMSSMGVHTGIFTDVVIALTFMLIPENTWSLILCGSSGTAIQ